MVFGRGGTGPDAGGCLGAFRRFWARSHAPDYLGFFILLAGWLTMIIFVEPFHRMFFVNDLHIMYPHAQVERVSVVMSIIYSMVLPLVVLIIFNLVTRAPARKHEETYLAFAITIVMAGFITDVIKNAVGRARPDLIDRCQPQEGTPADTLVTIDVCTETRHHVLHDGWRSFPSGHSSTAFAGLGFLSIFLAGQLRIFRHDGGGRDLSRALICLVPLLGAAMIAISRCEDYRHDVYDVSVGSALGFTVAYWSYRRHWPRLTARECHEPHPYPGAESKNGWHRVRDEEEAQPTGGANVGIEMSRLDSQRR